MRLRQPFSLVHRITALVVGVSVVALALHAGLMFYFLSSMGNDMVTHIASEVRSLSVVLAAVPETDRERVADAISGVGMRVSKMGSPPPQAPVSTFDGAAGPLVEKLELVLGRKVTLFLSFDDKGQAWWNMAVPGDAKNWWLSFHANRPSLLWGMAPVLLIAMAAVLGLVLGVRLITRPMSQLAQDLLDRRSELRQIDEPANLSVELQGVIRSFNALVHAVQLSAETRRNLLAGVSHDLRTPLARLRLRVEIECSEEVARRLDADLSALERIIDQFLAYAQGQSGIAMGEMYSIVDLVQEVVSQYRAEGGDVSLVRVEGSKLNVPDLGVQRALVNLVDNALSHGQGPIEIELWVEHDEVLVVVYDHGAGIAAHDVAKSFQPFVRLGPAPDQKGHCGLGLAIVRQIAEQLGGRTVWKAFDGRRSGIGFGLPA